MPSTRDFTRTDTTADDHQLPPFSGFSGAMVLTAVSHGGTFRSRARLLPQWRDRQSSNVGAVDKRLGSHAYLIAFAMGKKVDGTLTVQQSVLPLQPLADASPRERVGQQEGDLAEPR